MDQSKQNISRRSFVAGGAIAAIGASLALAGCSGGNSGGSSAESVASSASSASGLSGSNQSGTVAKTNTITAACAYSSTNYSPIDLCGGSALMNAATLHVFEGLYDLDLTTYETYRALAADEPVKISDTEYEISLRSGAKFSDGTSVTAADVVNSFEKNMAAPILGSFLTFISSVAAKDDATVSFMLNYPIESLIKLRLSMVKIFPAAKESQLDTLPIGSGPWKYVEGKLNGEDLGAIEFAPNPYYNGSKPAAADSMVWSVQKADDVARVAALAEGTVMAAEAIPDGNVEQLRAIGVEVEYVQSFGMPFLMFNTLKEPLNDKRVRQAFFYAIDTEKLIVNQMNGHATAAKGFLNETHPNFYQAANVFSYNPEKAKALLAEAGVTDLHITLNVNDNWVKELGAQIKNDLDAVGIFTELDVRAIDWPASNPVYETEGGPAIKPEGDKVSSYDVILSPGDPSCFGNDVDLLLSFWYSDNIWTQGRTFWKWADDSQFDRMQELMQMARESSDAAEQQELWNRCFDILSEDVPLYPLFHRQLATGWHSDMLEGFRPLATTGMLFLNTSVRT